MNKSDLKKIIAIGAVTAAAAAAAAIIITQCRKRGNAPEEEKELIKDVNAYITGGGLSALAAALYLARDCNLTPSNIHLLTNVRYDRGSEETGYVCHRGRLISENKSLNLFDLLNDVKSLDIPDLTVCDEILNIFSANPRMRNISFIDEDKNVTDISSIRLEKEFRNIIISLLQSKKDSLRSLSVREVFPNEFFSTAFWKLFRAAYGFSEESSAFEFVNCIACMDNTLSGTMPSDFDRHEEIIEPLTEHLRELGVDIRENALVTDIDFAGGRADAVHFTDNSVRKTVYLNDRDICIFPTDEMTECEARGSFNEPAPKDFSSPYQLWKKLSEKNDAFKDPSSFFDEFGAHTSEEFTITLSNRLLPELIDKVTCGALGNDGVIVLDNSAWKMTVCAVPSAHFKSQSGDVSVIWGYAARFDRDGAQSGKPMTECSGAEILYELVSCFNLEEAWEDIRETVINVIPCHRKYDKALLSPASSKLEIIPTRISNIAVSGNFAQYDSGTVFAEEYAVSTARTAAYRLMKTKKKVFSSKPASLKSIKRLLKNLSE